MKFLLQTLLLLPLLAGALPAPDSEVEQVQDGTIPNAYIVVLKETVGTQGLDSHLSWLDSVTKQVTAFSGRARTFNYPSLHGYAGEFDAETVALIKARPEVESVGQDGIVQTTACKKQTYSNMGLWGLGRISHTNVGPWKEYLYIDPLPNCDKKNYIAAYVIDSGVYTKHTEFGGRAVHLANTVGGDSNDHNDYCGHGTHVAATIGGATYGVAKNAKIYAIKALNGTMGGSCSGTWSGVMDAIKIAEQHAKKNGTISKSVINMSLGGSINRQVNDLVNNVVKGGLTIVVAAGNSGSDACQYSPASARGAITVGASNINDSITEWSNRGCCVDIYAPGAGVLSAYIGSPRASKIASGTSMASPHIAGLVLYNKCKHGFSSPARDADALRAFASPDKLKGLFCSIYGRFEPNHLAHNRNCTA